MNLIYQLQCTVCNAFYTGETSCSLSDRMNGHRFTTTVSNPDLPVAIHTQSHQIPFQECCLLVSYTNYLTPPQTTSSGNLKLHTNLSSNPDTPPVSISVNHPHSTLAPAALKFHFSILILLLRKATVIWPKYSFSFRFITICLSDAHPRAGRRSRLS